MVIGRAAGTRSAKRQLRFQLLAARANRPGSERAAAEEALCQRVLELPEVMNAGTIACYISSPDEPGTAPLIERLTALRRTVLLPVLLPDFDLDWAAYEPGALRSARFGLSEPSGVPLGAEGLSAVDVMICPGLGADSRGQRIGRGGGSYDRALSRLATRVLRVALLYDDEVLDAVPTDDHDEPVHVVVTPERTLRIQP